MACPEIRLECTHVQFPTSPSHPLTYEAKALYFGVESIAAQSTCITAREDQLRDRVVYGVILTVDSARRREHGADLPQTRSDRHRNKRDKDPAPDDRDRSSIR